MQNKHIITKCLLSAATLCCISGASLAQNNEAAKARLDSIQNLVTGWLKSNTTADRAEVSRTAYLLAGSGDEHQMSIGQYYLKSLGKDASADSLEKAIIEKFPKGNLVLNKRAQDVYDEKDPAKKEKLFKKLLSDIPEKTDQSGKVLDEGSNIAYDYMRNALSQSFIEAGDYDKGVSYTDKIVTKFWKGEGYGGSAAAMVKAEQLDKAKLLYKKAIAIAEPYWELHPTKGPEAFAATGYPGYLEGYASILTKEQKYDEALPVIEKAFNVRKEHSPDTYIIYVDALTKTGKYTKAFEVADEALKNGAATEDLKAQLKTLYAKVKGDNPSFETYMASAMKAVHEKYLKELPGTMLNLPSRNFTLKDLEGRSVSLNDYKGQTVVLDFWATWCGPCKRSFPAMKMAVNKYAEDKSVVFLFIDTWEKTADADEQVKKFIKNNSYPFRVLLDRKPESPSENMVVDKYGIKGIPTKFIIDPSGKIRFKLTGFSGGNDAAVQEISAMIELAQQS